MSRQGSLFERFQSEPLRGLLIMSSIGGGALGGAVSEAIHGSIVGAAIYTGLGFAGMTAAGVSVVRRHPSN